MATPSLRQTVVQKMDAFAIELLGLAKASESLADKIAAFEKIGKWVAIKNKLEDKEENMGASLNDLKRKLKIDASGTKGRPGNPHPSPHAQRLGGLARWGHPPPPDGNGGPALDALKAKLPASGRGADNGGVRSAGGSYRDPSTFTHRDQRDARPVVLGGYQSLDTGDCSGGTD